MGHTEKANLVDVKLVFETQAEIQAAALSFRALQAQVWRRKRDSFAQRAKNWFELHVLANKCEARNMDNNCSRMLRGDNVMHRPLEVKGDRNLGLLRHGVNVLIETELFGSPLSGVGYGHIEDTAPSHGEEIVTVLCEMGKRLDELGVPAVPTKT